MVTLSPFLKHKRHCGGVIKDMSLRGAKRRSKLKDKNEIASPPARQGLAGGSARNDAGESERGEAPLP